jgi:hypothetical protein
VRTVSAAATEQAREAVMEELGVTSSLLVRYSEMVEENESRSRELKRPLTAKHLSGGLWRQTRALD